MVTFGPDDVTIMDDEQLDSLLATFEVTKLEIDLKTRVDKEALLIKAMAAQQAGGEGPASGNEDVAAPTATATPVLGIESNDTASDSSGEASPRATKKQKTDSTRVTWNDTVMLKWTAAGKA